MNDSNNKEQALRLKKAREDAGYDTAIRASTRFHWKAPTYGSHENGSRNFSIKTAKTYAKAFKVDPHWLFDGREGEYVEIGIDTEMLAGVIKFVLFKYKKISPEDQSIAITKYYQLAMNVEDLNPNDVFGYLRGKD